MVDDNVKQKDIRQAESELAEIHADRGTLENLGKAKIERMRRSRSRKAARRRLKKAKKFDKEIDEVIDCFSNGRYDAGAAGVLEIADMWKTAGLELAGFLSIMEFIETQAIKKTGYESTRVHIKTALEKKKKRRIVSG